MLDSQLLVQARRQGSAEIVAIKVVDVGSMCLFQREQCRKEAEFLRMLSGCEHILNCHESQVRDYEIPLFSPSPLCMSVTKVTLPSSRTLKTLRVHEQMMYLQCDSIQDIVRRKLITSRECLQRLVICIAL